eukprot:scaffold656725_cov59-Attheya_sp.AAC.1
MAEDGSGFYSYRDGSISSSSTNEFGEDAALDHALLESLFYDMSDGDAGRMAGSTMDVSASNSTSSSSVSTSSFAQFLSEHTDSLNFLGSLSRTSTPPPPLGPPPSPLPFGSGLPPTPPSLFRAAPTPASLLEPSVDAWSMLIPSSSETSSAFAPEAVPSVPSSSTSLPPALNNNGPSAESSTTSATFHATTHHTTPQPQPQQNRAKQLVSQFATLASRLGISLPPNVLTSLTALAAQKEEASGTAAGDPSTTTTTTTPISGLNHHNTTTDSSRLAPMGMASPLQPPPLVPPSSMVPPMNNASLATPAVMIPTRTRPETIPSSQTRATTTTTLPMPLVPNRVSAHSFLTSSRQADTHMPSTDGDSSSLTSELRRTADAAVEAVQQTKKRDYPDETPSAASGSAPQQYSKRKKKPRLDDCERKVAELKRENAMLKRHLNNVLHKTQQFDKERQVAEAKMKTMVRKGASEEELHS